MRNEVTWDPAEAAGLSAADFELLGPDGAATLQRMQNLNDPRADLYGINNLPTEEPQKAPQAVSTQDDTTQPKDDLEPVQELPEGSQDVPDDVHPFLESNFRVDKISQLNGGAEEFDSLMARIENAGDEVIQAFMDSALSDDPSYADSVFAWSKHAEEAGADLTDGVEVSSISEADAADLISASEYGEDIVALNKQLVSGQISKADLIQRVATDPALLREAVRLRNLGKLSF